MKNLITAFALALVAGTLLGPAAYGKTQIFQETNESDFAQGRAEGIVWTSAGTLRLGRAVDGLLPVTEGVEYVARLAEGPDGAVYAATGASGRVYRLRDGKVALFATVPDKFLFSCAVDKKGNVYVGSGGTKGRVWRITPQAKGDPKAEVVFEADDVKYVWDLAWLKDGALAAATGDKGKIYRITADNKKGEVLISADADHVLCLAVSPEGTLYAGTDGNAIVYRHANKKTFVLYDADEAEVTALTVDAAGNLYVATSSGVGGRSGGAEIPAEAGVRTMTPGPPAIVPSPKGDMPDAAPSADKPAKDGPAAKPAETKTPTVPLAVMEKTQDAMMGTRPQPPGRPAGPPTPGGRGASVYRIAPDGIVTRVFESRDAMILAVAVSDGRLMVGTGRSARVYEAACASDEEEACVASVDPKQVMSLLATRDGRVLAGSAGPGRIYALSKGFATQGTYTSQVYDAGGSARWGMIEWRGRTPDGSEIALSTRSGNVRDPEKGMWSEWVKPSAKSPVKIESPAARFIQFRVTMRGRGATPVLEQYEAAYLRANEPPKVLSIAEVMTPEQQARAQALERFRQSMKPQPKAGGPAQPPPAAPQPPPPEGPQPIRIIRWQAIDPNADALRYDLYLREQGETNWILIDKDLTQPQYAWDTATVADGSYEIKVVASDRPDNPADTALEGWKISDPILVDNTAPVIEKVKVQVRAGGEAEVEFTARDAASRITDAAYTIDSATEWRPIVPTDGIFDGQTKDFKFTIHKLPPGPHRLTLRVADEALNIGRAAQTLTVDK